MKVLLANMPWKEGGRIGVRAGSRWPHLKSAYERDYRPYPFFLGYAASLLKKEGFEVKLIDALAQDMGVDEFLSHVSKYNPDLLVAEISTPSLRNDLGILARMPKNTHLAVCGPNVRYEGVDLLKKNEFIKYAFIGEYEASLLKLAKCMSSKNNPADIGGLIYRGNMGVAVNNDFSLIENLDILPWPLREKESICRYDDRPGEIPAPSAQMLASRGCPYGCIFCAWPQLMFEQSRYRVRSIKDVVDEMDFLVNKLNFKSIYFDDDTFNVGKQRMMEFARLVKERDLKIPWSIMARPDLMDEEILKELRSAGLSSIKYGVESSSQKLLDLAQKKMNLKDAQKMILFTKSLGIKVHLTFTFGLPGENKDTMRQSIDYAISLDPDSVQFSITTPFPGTKYYELLKKEGFICSNVNSDYDGASKAVFNTNTVSSSELTAALRLAHKSWQAHIWNTRYNKFGLRDIFKRTIHNLELFGLFTTIIKGKDFLIFRSEAAKRKIKKSSISVVLNLMHLKRKINDKGLVSAYKHVKYDYMDLLGIFSATKAFKGPRTVQIDLTNNCNNDCIGCWCNSSLLKEKKYSGSRKYKTITTIIAKDLIDELFNMGTRDLYFSGGGDPFMHPDLLDIVEYAKQKGFSCSINTNFTRINVDIIKRIINIGVDGLTVSLWAATTDIYMLTHPNKDKSAFYHVCQNLKILNNLKKSNKFRPLVKIYNVISNINYSEIKAMADLAVELGADEMEYAAIDTIPNATDSLILNAQQRENVLTQCRQLKALNPEIRISNLDNFMRRISDEGAGKAQYDSQFINSMPCYIGWLFARIMPNGDVNSCLKSHRIPIGNIYQNSFRSIWNNRKQIEFRKKTLRKDKDDPYFMFIGNDESCNMGCFKSCDDLGRNMQMHERIKSMTFIEKGLIRACASALKFGKPT